METKLLWDLLYVLKYALYIYQTTLYKSALLSCILVIQHNLFDAHGFLQLILSTKSLPDVGEGAHLHHVIFSGVLGKSGGVAFNNMAPQRTSCRWSG